MVVKIFHTKRALISGPGGGGLNPQHICSTLHNFGNIQKKMKLFDAL